MSTRLHGHWSPDLTQLVRLLKAGLPDEAAMSETPAPVVTRFAPSPTGYLHIGGARTALFNWLFARHHGGQFRLRIEDTDRARSTPEAIDAIMKGMTWLELDWDGEVVFQFARAARHAAVAMSLLEQGKAYRCYASPQELEEMRAAQKAAGQPVRYDGRWRDRDPADAPPGVAPVIRLKAAQSGETRITDLVQGEVIVQNSQLDDMVLLRADGTPTYMLSVVVDDEDMGITHVIRGDDHLNNAFRQLQLIRAMGFGEPAYAHIPLIHGSDGAKLSKRHGALAVGDYADMGYLPEAMENALLRLGWSHGDEEIISRADATRWFGLEQVGRAASRFDMKKLDSLNSHYLKAAEPARLVAALGPFMDPAPDAAGEARLAAALPVLAPRAVTLKELAAGAAFLFTAPDPAALPPDVLASAPLLALLHDRLASLGAWTTSALDTAVRDVAADQGLGLGKIAMPLRIALTGSSNAPGFSDILYLLGRNEALGRLAFSLPGNAVAA
jgi:glutamyl-tRNA synthetase